MNFAEVSFKIPQFSQSIKNQSPVRGFFFRGEGKEATEGQRMEVWGRIAR
jgi:hypothetical protein